MNPLPLKNIKPNPPSHPNPNTPKMIIDVQWEVYTKTPQFYQDWDTKFGFLKIYTAFYRPPFPQKLTLQRLKLDTHNPSQDYTYPMGDLHENPRSLSGLEEVGYEIWPFTVYSFHPF